MWSAILNFVGWAGFYLVILFYVRWIVLERTYFAGQDPEAWKPGAQPNEAPESKAPLNLPCISSLGRPA